MSRIFRFPRCCCESRKTMKELDDLNHVRNSNIHEADRKMMNSRSACTRQQSSSSVWGSGCPVSKPKVTKCSQPANQTVSQPASQSTSQPTNQAQTKKSQVESERLALDLCNLPKPQSVFSFGKQTKSIFLKMLGEKSVSTAWHITHIIHSTDGKYHSYGSWRK